MKAKSTVFVLMWIVIAITQEFIYSPEKMYAAGFRKAVLSAAQKAINKAFYLSLEIPGEKQRFYNNMVDFLEQKD